MCKDHKAEREPLLADYNAKCAALWADYEAKRKPLVADYEAKDAALWADHAAEIAKLLDI